MYILLAQTFLLLFLLLQARAGLDYESSYGKERPNDTILKLQRTTPYYKRNRAHICSFYIRGECTRGAECPYRHEMPVTGELSQQNIKDRYYGYATFHYPSTPYLLRAVYNLFYYVICRVNDPVALKLLNKAGEMPSLEPPEDESIRTLYVGGLDARVSEQDLRDNFYSHGEIESVKMVLQRACAFVTYTTREGAEKAAEELSNKLVIKGLRLKLMWGRPQAPKTDGELGSDEARQQAVAHSGLLPRAVISQQQNQFQPPGTSASHDQQPPPHMQYFNIPPPPPQHGRAFYPSMDPQRMGAVIHSQDGSGASGSGENRSGGSDQRPHYAAYPPPPPPPQGGGGQYYPQYYPPPPYGYGPPPPSYPQYPPPAHPSSMPPRGPNGEQAYQQKPPAPPAAATAAGPPPQQ